MKKKLAVLLAAVMALGVIGGCGKKEEAKDVPVADLDTSKYVTLGAYSGLEVTVAPVSEITDENVQTYINTAMLTSYVENVEVTDRTVQTGDTVTYSCVGTMDGEVFEGGSSAEGADWETVIGSGTMIDGFEDGFIGMSLGETKDIVCTFPTPYNSKPEYSGKEAVFTVTVNLITEEVYPELTEDILAEIESEYTTPDEAYAGVRNMLEEAAVEEYNNSIEDAILTQVLNNCEFKEPPQNLVDINVAAFRENMEGYASVYGMDFATFLSMLYGISEAEFDTYANQIGVKAAQQTIALEAIADAEGLSDISEEELSAEAEAYIAGNNRYATVDEMYGDVGKDSFRDYIISQRVLAWLAENNSVAE